MEIKTARTLLTVSAREWWWRKEKSLSRALASLVCYRIIEKKKDKRLSTGQVPSRENDLWPRRGNHVDIYDFGSTNENSKFNSPLYVTHYRLLHYLNTRRRGRRKFVSPFCDTFRLDFLSLKLSFLKPYRTLFLSCLCKVINLPFLKPTPLLLVLGQKVYVL